MDPCRRWDEGNRVDLSLLSSWYRNLFCDRYLMPYWSSKLERAAQYNSRKVHRTVSKTLWELEWPKHQCQVHQSTKNSRASVADEWLQLQHWIRGCEESYSIHQFPMSIQKINIREELLAWFLRQTTILIACWVQTLIFKECRLPMCNSHKQKQKALLLAFRKGHRLDRRFRMWIRFDSCCSGVGGLNTSITRNGNKRDP